MSRRKQTSRRSSALLIVIIGIVLLGAAIYLAAQARPAAMPVPAPSQPASPQPTAATAAQGEDHYPNVPRVELADAKAAFDQKTAVFVDVRGASVYAQGHIPGALSIPLDEFETHWRELDPNAWIITYCT